MLSPHWIGVFTPPSPCAYGEAGSTAIAFGPAGVVVDFAGLMPAGRTGLTGAADEAAIEPRRQRGPRTLPTWVPMAPDDPG
jgi:hypothetical protein